MSITVRGSRVLLNQPQLKELPLEVPEELKQELINQELKKAEKIEVFAVGSEVTDIKPGDIVYVSPYTLANAEIIELDGAVKMVVRAADVAIIW